MFWIIDLEILMGDSMKIEPPLANMIDKCQAICVAECCGIGAYDFSPIHIASFLIQFRGKPDLAEVQLIRVQIENLRVNYGLGAKSGSGTVIEAMNQSFLAEEIERMAEEMRTSLEVALELIGKCEELRYKKV